MRKIKNKLSNEEKLKEIYTDNGMLNTQKTNVSNFTHSHSSRHSILEVPCPEITIHNVSSGNGSYLAVLISSLNDTDRLYWVTWYQ